MTIYSQRDPRWADVNLGSSTTTTISSHGCTITSLGMVANINPLEVNNRLKNVNGYAETNKVLWTKVGEAIPWLKFEWRGYTYENGRVVDAIQRNGFCLVEVDGSRIGGTKHWVVYIGNQRMYDPWTGIEKDTNYYPPTGYSIINKIDNPPPVSEDCLVKNDEEGKKLFENLVAKASKFDAVNAEGYQIFFHGEVIAKYEINPTDKINELEQKLQSEAEHVNQLTSENAVLSGKLTQQEADNTSLTNDIRRISQERDSYLAETISLKNRITTLEADNQTLKQKLEAENPLANYTRWELLRYILRWR